jgi:hypothetical protein
MVLTSLSGAPAYEASLVGVDHCLDAVAQPELCEHTPEVGLHVASATESRSASSAFE